MNNLDSGARRNHRLDLASSSLRLVSCSMFVGLAAVLFNDASGAFAVSLQGPSMRPTFEEGFKVLIAPASDRFSPKRGDVVSVHPGILKRLFKLPLIKRLVGLPGDVVSIRDNRLFVNNCELPLINQVEGIKASGQSEWKIPEGYCFVIGDNCSASYDSRAADLGLISLNRLRRIVAVETAAGEKVPLINPWSNISIPPGPAKR